MKNTGKYLFAFALALANYSAMAQEPEMADAFRANGKIYVVISIILIILAGFIAYLFLTDRKLSRLEKEIQNRRQGKS